MRFFLTVIAIILSASNVGATEMTKVSGSACEIYNNNQSKSSVRVRVTDKASYNAVSQIPALSELRSKMLEHDFNVIVYNLVDNYVQNLSVNTINQSDDELCVEVTGSIPAADISSVIADYSPSNPAPEYDFKKANDIVEEVNEPFTEDKPSQAEVLYNGRQDFDTVPPPSTSAVVYQDDSPDTEPEKTSQDVTMISETAPVEEGTPPSENYVPDVTIEESPKSLVYVGPVEFSNNTHSSKPVEVIKGLFDNEEVYTVLEYPDGADYTITSKVLKAKIDQINAQTRRLQMVVATELKISGSDGSISDHQNRFVLFDSDENEQEVAMNLLRKLLFKSGKKLFARVEQNERKRRGREFLTPAK